MLEELVTPPAILSDIWSRLQQAVADPSLPFHTPAVAITDELQGATVRTIVLRRVDVEQRALFFHTDRRSTKFSLLMQDLGVGWLFWDPANRLQLALQTAATIHTQDAIAHEQWVSSAPSSRSTYQTPLAPGTVLPAMPTKRPAPQGDGRDNFAVIRCVVERIDWLYLHPAAHRRARFTWPEEQMKCEWLAP